MPIIKSKNKESLVAIKCQLRASINKEIEDYCEWAECGDIPTFISEAVEYVLSVDKDWKKHKKQQFLAEKA